MGSSQLQQLTVDPPVPVLAGRDERAALPLLEKVTVGLAGGGSSVLVPVLVVVVGVGVVGAVGASPAPSPSTAANLGSTALRFGVPGYGGVQGGR